MLAIGAGGLDVAAAMGGVDEAVRGGSYAISDAWRSYPLGVMLHMADLEATYLLERGTSRAGKA